MDFKKQLQTKEDCIQFISNLCIEGLDFHFDDDPSDIPCFTKEEAVDVKHRIKECFSLLDDPFTYSLEAK